MILPTMSWYGPQFFISRNVWICYLAKNRIKFFKNWSSYDLISNSHMKFSTQKDPIRCRLHAVRVCLLDWNILVTVQLLLKETLEIPSIWYEISFTTSAPTIVFLSSSSTKVASCTLLTSLAIFPRAVHLHFFSNIFPQSLYLSFPSNFLFQVPFFYFLHCKTTINAVSTCASLKRDLFVLRVELFSTMEFCNRFELKYLTLKGYLPRVSPAHYKPREAGKHGL